MPLLKNNIMKTNAFALAAVCMLVITGCGKKEPQFVEVQEVKESPVTVEKTMHSDMDGHDHGTPGAPFEFEIPTGWTEKEHSSMILMAFQAGSPPEVMADMSVSVFPGDVGGQLANINRWRGQVGLGPVDPVAAKDFVTELEISGLSAWQVSFTGPVSASKVGEPVRMVVSAVFQDGKTWFFKLVGTESAVADELANYNAFISSVIF